MIMTNLFKDVFDPTLAKVGNAVEPIVRDYLTKILNQKYLVYDPSKINWDVFKENTIFGGVPDGEPINSSGAVDYTNASPMIEIKTTSIDSFVYVSKNSQLQMQKDNNGYPIIKQPRGKYNS
jgi:hypothetical protein